MPILLILIFCATLFLSLVLTAFVRDFASARGWLDTPRLDRHVHTTPVPRMGGVAIFISFIVGLGLMLVSTKSHWPQTVPSHAIWHLLGPALIVFSLGLYDDLRGLNPYWKFLIQGFAAVLLFLGGHGIDRFDLFFSGQPLRTMVGLPLTILWVLLITNALNLVDGLDGLAAGSALFSTTVMFVLSLLAPNPVVSFLTIGLAGAILGFLRFNFHPASIFLGDSGSLFIGFMLSALAIMGSQKAPMMVAVAIPLVALGLPILDVALAVSRRFLNGKPLFMGDRDHIHHRLLKRGLSQREAVLILYAVTAGFGFVSLLILRHATAIALILALTGIAVIVGVWQLRYRECDEVLSIMHRSPRRRELVPKHVAIRHATELLNACDTFKAVCQILQDSLRPIGFDGFCFQMLHPNGFAPSSFQPLSYEPDGKLVCSWAAHGIDKSPWELRLELVTISGQRWGYFSLWRLSDIHPIALDLNILTVEFRTALSGAVERACTMLESNKGPVEPHVRKVTVG